MRRRGSAYSKHNEQSIDNQSTYSKLINESNVNLSHFEKFVKGKLDHMHKRSSSLVDSQQEGPKKIYSFKMPFLTKDLQLTSRQEVAPRKEKTIALESEEDRQAAGSKGKLNLLVSKEIFKRNSCIHDNTQVKNLSSRRSIMGNNQPYPIDSLLELEPKYQDGEQDHNLSANKLKHNASRTTNFTVMTRNQLNDSSRNLKFHTKVNSHTMSLAGSANDIFSSKISPKEHQAMLDGVGTIILPQDSACPSLVLPEAATQQKQGLKFIQDGYTSEVTKCISELEIQQKLEKLVHRENSSRGSSRQKHSRTELNSSIDQLAVQLQKEAEFNQIHKELVLKLKAHVASPKTQKIMNKNIRTKRVSKENSFSISKATIRHMRSSSVGETPLDKSTSMVQNRQSVLDRSFKQKLVKQKTLPVAETIPEWLKQREDFKGAFSLRGDELSKAIIATCNKLPYSRTEEEIKAVKGWLHNVKLFQHLPEFMIYNIGSKIKHQFYLAGETLCKEGEPEDCLFIIYDGIVRSSVSGIEAETYHMFETIGQSPLESSSNRPITLVAETDVSTLKLARHEYRSILEQHLSMERTAYLFLLDEIDFIKDLDEKKRKLIASNLKSKRFTKGQIIYEEGEESENFYIIRSGKVQLESKVRVEKENIWPTGVKVWEKTKHIRDMKFHYDIKAKQYFGEVEMIDGCSRRNTVVCAEDAELLVLRSNEFFGIFSKDELDRLRNSVQSMIIEETLDLKHRVIREEDAKKKIMDSTVKTLLNLKESSRERNIFRPKTHSLQPLAKKIQNKYHSYIQQNTIKTLKAHEILRENPYGA